MEESFSCQLHSPPCPLAATTCCQLLSALFSSPLNPPSDVSGSVSRGDAQRAFGSALTQIYFCTFKLNFGASDSILTENV